MILYLIVGYIAGFFGAILMGYLISLKRGENDDERS